MHSECSSGIKGGIIGCTWGGMTWLMLGAIVIGSYVTALAVFLAAVLFTIAAVRLVAAYPQHHKVILGLNVVWVCPVDLALLHSVYVRLPPSVGPLTTGKDYVSEGMCILLLLLCGLAGTTLILRGIAPASRSWNRERPTHHPIEVQGEGDSRFLP